MWLHHIIRYICDIWYALVWCFSFAEEKPSNEVSLYEIIDQPEDLQYYEINKENYYFQENDNAYEDVKKKNKKKKKKKEKLNPYKIEFVTQEPQDRVTYAFDFKNEISKFSRSKFNKNGQVYKPDNPFKPNNSATRISCSILTLPLLYIF